MRKTVSIHQPNFFPWLGYFDKIVRSDNFILLDHVQFQKTGGAWQNRVKIIIAGDPCWITAPIIRNYRGVRATNEMEFQASTKWREKIWKTIVNNYSKHLFFAETKEIIEPLIFNSESYIANYNIHTIVTISKHLGIETDKLYLSSELPYKGNSNELLVSLTKAVNGEIYLCGGGADSYQDEATFADDKIELLYQNFQHPEYSQKKQKEFIAGLSIIDALMNVGVNGVRSILKI